jgi:nucleosome binding factor SPN SPT16 subunit
LLLSNTNRIAEAEPLYRRALAIFIRLLGWEHPSTVTVQENLTATLVAMGRSQAKARTAVEALVRAREVTP